MKNHIFMQMTRKRLRAPAGCNIIKIGAGRLSCPEMVSWDARLGRIGRILVGPSNSDSRLAGELGKNIMPDQWNNFFVMVGGGAAALAGLIFVAMSINHEIIIRNTTHKNRAINMLTGFTAVFMASSFALIGNQNLGMLGFEWLVLWLIATAIFIRGYVIAIKSGMSSIGLTMPRLAGGTVCYLAEVISAILLILGYSSGLYIAAIAVIVLFAFLISGAWLLMIGIYEDRTK
jgi:hypothetical protein